MRQEIQTLEGLKGSKAQAREPKRRLIEKEMARGGRSAGEEGSCAQGDRGGRSRVPNVRGVQAFPKEWGSLRGSQDQML